MAAPESSAEAVALIGLGPLMEDRCGSADVGIGLVDGPVAADHADLAEARLVAVAGDAGACARNGSGACEHGTFVAGILVARRGSAAPAICPGCTLLVRPIFRETGSDGSLPAATPEDVAAAIVACVQAGARIVNLSAATGEPTTRAERSLRQALDHAARRGVLVVAAAGNQGALGSSEITRHPAVIPVVAYDLSRRPMGQSNLGTSIGRRGLGAPGGGIVSLAAEGAAIPRAGTSFAAPFVSGALALLWSLYPAATATMLRQALSHGLVRRSVIPPLMDASAAQRFLAGREPLDGGIRPRVSSARHG